MHGADRYLIRFETSNRELYNRIHPSLGHTPSDRFAILRSLKEMGYETGSGVMIGIPGQTYHDLARDILAFRTLDLDMIGVGPFIPHAATPLGCLPPSSPFFDQVPNTEKMTYKVIALTRLVCPEANIHGSGQPQQSRWPGTWPDARRKYSHAQPDTAAVPRDVRNLSQQGLYQ